MSELNNRSRYQHKSLKFLPGVLDRDTFFKSCRIVEEIGPECDSGWEIVSNVSDCTERRFIHHKYMNKHGEHKHYKIGVLNKLNHNSKTIYKYLYPMVDPNLDINQLGFSFHNFNPISNKFQIFWDTRRGKRYSKYINYRKYREMIKKQHSPETEDKSLDKHRHDAEFEKYLIEKNEKKRIMLKRMEDEEDENKKNESEFYEDDYKY